MQASRPFKVSGLDWVHRTLGNVILSAGQPFRTHLRDTPVHFPSLNCPLLIDGWMDSSFCRGARAAIPNRGSRPTRALKEKKIIPPKSPESDMGFLLQNVSFNMCFVSGVFLTSITSWWSWTKIKLLHEFELRVRTLHNIFPHFYFLSVFQVSTSC